MSEHMILIGVLTAIGMVVVLVGSLVLFLGVALNEEKDTLKRVFAAIGALLLFFGFWYSLFVLGLNK